MKKSDFDSTTILCILAIILLVVIMVLPPMLRILVDDDEGIPEQDERKPIAVGDISNLNKNGMIDCSKDNSTITLSYKDEIIYQYKSIIKYDNATSQDIDTCNIKADNYKNTKGVTGICEYDSGKFVESFTYNINYLEDSSDLPIEKNTNIRVELKKYIEDNYTCYLK